ncbi:MBL fold metallo-hydrolase [Actinokineospora iranica]|uniref:Glyoxylase, beta-lactamase superfamily II n=1 Tax=Actinokineospora iranica TaxID=1271860 RepID=A0A1G6THP2_9PSEU|nr:MBL fold metallo-hydrolase [Actinokineospora iranica]SDD28608.1 Glyoxylase, beta-lactamase superfamily II [Actinokineospora iranica]
MRVTHLDCGPMRPPGGRLLDGKPGVFRSAEFVCHVLLIESEDGLVLVDTGFGLSDLANPPGSLPPLFAKMIRPIPDPDNAAISRITALGYDPSDVRHIILTHLDLDHAGGLPDFPDARVHVYAPEHQAAMTRKSRAERDRYRPAQWAHGPKWEIHTPQEGGDEWFGFNAVRTLTGLPEDFLLVPLPGHTQGHTGIAVRTETGWLLHAGDAYFTHTEMNQPPSCPPLLRAFESQAQMNAQARHTNQNRLRDLVKTHSPEVTVFSAHDATELARLTTS